MPRFHITPVVLNLLIVNVLVFLALNLLPYEIDSYFQLYKLDWIFDRQFVLDNHHYNLNGAFKPVQIVTSFFAHKEIWHIAMNMLALVSFGPMLEMVMKPRRFLTAYLVIGLLSSFIDAVFDPSPIPVIGASGALFGLFVLYAYYFPQAKMGLLFIPGSFKVRSFVIFAAILSFVLVIVEMVTHQSMGGISHAGHLSGMIAGFAFYNFGKIIIATKPKR